jgi:hypothetical protein
VTFATPLAADWQSECQIRDSTSNLYLLNCAGVIRSRSKSIAVIAGRRATPTGKHSPPDRILGDSPKVRVEQRTSQARMERQYCADLRRLLRHSTMLMAPRVRVKRPSERAAGPPASP